MKISHIALYTNDLEKLTDFYVRYFNGTATQKYCNPVRGFSSYFVRFGTDEQLELMTLENGLAAAQQDGCSTGYAHMAFSPGNRQDVDRLTEMLRAAGYTVASGPRMTGDGHWESCVLDPDGNQVEITAEG